MSDARTPLNPDPDLQAVQENQKWDIEKPTEQESPPDEELSTRKVLQQLLNSQDFDANVLISIRGSQPGFTVTDVDFDEDGNTVLSVT